MEALNELRRRRLAAVVGDENSWRAELELRARAIEAQSEALVAGEAARQELTHQIAATQQTLGEREREITRLSGEIVHRSNQAAETERQLILQLAEATRQLQDLRSSFSWRATVPLRHISARLPGSIRRLRRFRHVPAPSAGADSDTAQPQPPLDLPAPPAPLPMEPAPPPAAIEPPSIDLPRPRHWLVGGDGLATEILQASARSAAPFAPWAPADTGLPPDATPSPIAGDHVLFASDAPWASATIGRLGSLSSLGIAWSLLVRDVAALFEHADPAWLRLVLTQAHCLFVADPAARDRILRWAALSDLYVAATVSAVEFATAEAACEVIVAGMARAHPAPLGQPGRLFLPGIPAPDKLPALAAARAWCTQDDPQVSILIIDRNTVRLTRACIQHIWANTAGIRYEIIVADNCSDPAARQALGVALGSGVRLLPMGADRFFGETCNVAAEQARGALFCILGNDCFVQPGWLPALVEALDADRSVAAAGPLLLSPDMTTLEAGATVTDDGVLVPLLPETGSSQLVDHVPAAGLLIRRDAFLRAGGFDLMFEPESFEDVDLCFKLKALGLSVRSCPSAEIVRLPADPDAQARHRTATDINRAKFISRWGAFLRSRSDADLAAAKRQTIVDAPVAPAPDTMAKTVALYTPYAITPGGGERFLLTMASELMRDHRVVVVTPNPYSQLRLRTIGHVFGIDLSQCRTQTEAGFVAGEPPDLTVVLGNFVYPPIPSRVPNGVFVCQFPFPLPPNADLPRIDEGYRAVIAYSDYARTHIQASLAAHGMPRWPVEIVYPPVPQIGDDFAAKRPMILTVGRFFAGGHNKRHDLLIDAFRRVLDAVGPEVELHLAGSSTPGAEHLRYLETLMRPADGLPITFHVNASPDTLQGLYRQAAIYWHATGLGADLATHPELAEHFGISLVEAMSAGCVPLAFDAGGPREIVTQGVDGFLYTSLDELVTRTADLLQPAATALRTTIAHAATKRAATFAPEAFATRLRQLLLPLLSA